MPKKDPKLVVEIPRPGSDQPIWSRVGIIGVAGFVLGIAWPRVAGWKIGPSVPSDLAAKVEGTAGPAASARAPKAAPSGAPSAAASAGAPAPEPSASAAADEKPASNRELVVVGPGKITKCSDKKGGPKIEDCGQLQFDPIAVKRLKDLARCPSAVGLAGKMSIGFDINFGKKEVGVKKVSKGTSLPASTVSGIIACAAHDFANVALDEVPHKHRYYTVVYGIAFYPPGKHPEEATPGEGDADGGAAGSTTDRTEATGTAIVSWDTALIRKDPKDGDVVARVVRGTKLKILGRQNDWYKVDANGKVGWVYRGSIGL